MKFLIASALTIIFHLAQAALDAKALTSQHFGNDAPWYLSRIPLFESSDKTLEEVYYYRWSIFRAHQRDLGSNGFISTEFLNDVGWQTEPWASLNDATGFHLQEGRWCRDRRFKEDYATFIYSGDSNTRQFSESMAAAVWQGYLVDGVLEDAVARIDAMQAVYNAWVDSYDADKGLYWVEPLRDATEYTISSIDASGGIDGFTGGDSFRPSINSFQYANAKAISNLAALKGGMDDTVVSFNSKAASIKNNTQTSLWNTTLIHFIDRFKVNNTYVRYFTPIRGRELVGYVPWTHDLPDDTISYAQAWSHILDNSELAGEHGLRTNEPSYEYYMRQYRYEGSNPECQWNGPVWPFQTTQLLTGLANFLDHYAVGASTGLITKTDYNKLLRQYAQLHYNPDRGGILDIEEDYYPDTGAPIVGLKRSPHYFHSGFIDLILSGFVGIRACADDVLEVNPLADASTTYFRADSILYHGHDIAVQWDATGARYGTQGLQVEVDGVVATSSPELTRLSVPIARVAAPAVARPVAKSVQLGLSTTYPVGNVSVTDPAPVLADIHSAIDGRVFFFPEADVANGWDTPVGNGSEVWFQIDFGASTTVASAELAFFADGGQGFDTPASYRVQGDVDGVWGDVEEAKYGEVVGNGITNVEWKGVSVEKIRLVFKPKVGSKVRLVEFKVF
ncbi:six-hairpin glycosidase [Melanomma pulvis-pyrius CBS 109.77]|uniref:Six-hairpin glycosidase n=1 Tax=Melanomma pulvis-pyrius CBS 109.77 TaxID=1314802 RepID=A0A6A6X605_9PLEO|nr:six-hairpin glycosidase [Melanomma pulvis-pyrius CBS 109.77]